LNSKEHWSHEFVNKRFILEGKLSRYWSLNAVVFLHLKACLVNKQRRCHNLNLEEIFLLKGRNLHRVLKSELNQQKLVGEVLGLPTFDFYLMGVLSDNLKIESLFLKGVDLGEVLIDLHLIAEEKRSQPLFIHFHAFEDDVY